MTASYNEPPKRPPAKTLGLPKWMVALTDLSLANLAIYLSFILVTGELQGFQIGPLLILFPAISVVTVIIFASLGLYTRQRSGFAPVVRAILTAVVGIFVFTIIFAFMTRTFLFQRLVFVVALGLQFVLLLAWRALHFYLERWVHGRQKLLVVGAGAETDMVLKKLTSLPGHLFAVEAVLERFDQDEFKELLPKTDAVLMAGDLELKVKDEIIRESFTQAKDLFVVPGLYEIILTRAQVTQAEDAPLVECLSLSLSLAQQLFKRAFDLALTVLLIIPALPLLLIAGLVVRFDSPGPVIYRQERVGLKGKVFTLYKLRTMAEEAERISGPVFAMEEDDRVTKAGRFLRKTRLDELPQLFNVLIGDLSLVGPRPERPFFVEKFMNEMPEYSLRHLVKPGITGLAQVAGYYSTNTYDKLKHDLSYLADYSLALDFKILLLTIPTLFNFKAAQGVEKND